MVRSRRAEILDAALETFAERGYRGTSLNAIAERVGLTRQGVLHYFPSKEKLLIALLEHREVSSRERVGRAHDDGDWPATVSEVVAHDRGEPGRAQVYSVLMTEALTEGHPAHAYFRDYYRRLHGYMAGRLAERYGETLPSGLAPSAVATALLALLDGMQQQWLLDRDRADHPEVMREVLARLIGD